MNRLRLVLALAALSLAVVVPPASAVEMLFAVTDDHEMLRVRAGAPGVSDWTQKLKGVPDGGVPLDIDFRPATGELLVAYRVGKAMSLYRIDPRTGNLTRQGTGSVDLGSPAIGASISFDEDTDRLRVIASDGRNLLVSPDTGALLEEQAKIAYVAGDPGAGKTPRIAGMTYRRPLSGGQGLLAVDQTTDALIRVGGLLAPPLPDTGELRSLSKIGFPFGTAAAMDSSEAEATVYAALTPDGERQSSLFSMNTPPGPLRYVGPFVSRDSVVGLAVAPGGVHDFDAAAYYASERGGEAQIGVSRSGTTSAAASVAFSAIPAGAEAGVDFTPVSGVVGYAPGQREATFAVPVLPDETLEGPETVQLLLGDPGGPSGLGLRRGAILTILDGGLTRDPSRGASTPSGGAGRPTTVAGEGLAVALAAPVLRRLGTRLRVPVTCSATCRVTLQARLDGPTARRLKRATFMGAGSATLARGGAGTVTVKLSRRRGLSRLRSGRVRLTLRAWDVRGRRLPAISTMTPVRR
ncbi:MAG: DUF4394 domain-containing protein [Solirubrobacteraceae bacterium]|nr:DUF4394 domain-containing protein [Solirubrobacteraceae bacterium]